MPARRTWMSVPAVRPHILPLMLSLTLALSACESQEVYGKLHESEANEAVAVLQQADIRATKSSGAEGEWSISVDPEDFPRAVEVLKAKGLPRGDFASLGQIFEKKGFVSSPTEERARLVYGLSQELSHTVSEIDGVVQARVHLAIPEPDPLSEKVKPSSAAVFVKYQPGYDLRDQTGAIKSLVTNSIEGLAYERVSVVMVPSQAAPDESADPIVKIGSPIVAAGLGLAGIGGLLFALFTRRRTPRRTSGGTSGQIAGRELAETTP